MEIGAFSDQTTHRAFIAMFSKKLQKLSTNVLQEVYWKKLDRANHYSADNTIVLVTSVRLSPTQLEDKNVPVASLGPSGPMVFEN